VVSFIATRNTGYPAIKEDHRFVKPMLKAINFLSVISVKLQNPQANYYAVDDSTSVLYYKDYFYGTSRFLFLLVILAKA
jgi:hypothetical protein